MYERRNKILWVLFSKWLNYLHPIINLQTVRHFNKNRKKTHTQAEKYTIMIITQMLL